MFKDCHSLRNYSIRLTEHALNETKLGLSGKLGVAIYLLEYARWSTQNNFLAIGEWLVSDVLEHVSFDSLEFSYHDGILGVGIGIAYLYNRGFIDGDSDEILEEFDELIQYTINYRKLDEGQINIDMLGILFYLYLRTKERHDLTLSLLKNREHLIYAIDWLESLYNANKVSDDRIYTILCLLHQSKIYPTKTDVLLMREFNRLEQIHNPRVYSDIDLLGIPSLSALQPWITPSY